MARTTVGSGQSALLEMADGIRLVSVLGHAKPLTDGTLRRTSRFSEPTVIAGDDGI